MEEHGGESGSGPSEDTLERELIEWLPKVGDMIFVSTLSGATLDPLGFTAYSEPRKLTGRWRLYTDGFLSAGDRLVEGCAGAAWEDELIYPMLNLYRHHLELLMKCVIRCSPHYTDDLGKWLSGTHSLRDLWGKISEVYPRFSVWASRKCTEACSRMILEFDSHDPTSQASRYPIDRKGNQTLPRLEVIDLAALKRGIHKASHYLDTIIEQIGEDREWEAEMAGW